MPLLQGILTTLLLAFCLVAQAEPMRERAERTLAEAQCQTSLPGDPGSEERDAGREPAQPLGHERKEPRSGIGDFAIIGSAAGLAQLVLWLALAVAVAVLLVVIVRAFRGRTEAAARPAVLRATAGEQAPEPEQHAPDHARLANDGQFGAAIHALLRHAFAIGHRQLGVLPVHATGREVLRRASGQRLPAAALGAIVRAVEWSHFGGRPAERSHYEDCVRHYAQWEAQCKTPS